MSRHALHPLAEDYLRRLRQACRQLPSERRDELLTEIERHLADAIPSDASEAQALDVLERLGAPGEIVEAEWPSSPGPIDRRGWREWAAVILLPLGGFVFGVGWLVGLALLWSSRLWSTRDKLVGTLIVPGGIATTLLVVVLTGTKRRCTTLTTPNPPIRALVGHMGMHCAPSSGASTAATVWHAALIVFFLLGPVVSAIYLARRARAMPVMASSSST